MLIGRFQGTPKGTLGADGPLGEKIVLAGTQMGVYFQSPEGQKGNSGWRVQYNTVRPHSALGYRPPAPGAYSPPLPLKPVSQPQAAM